MADPDSRGGPCDGERLRLIEALAEVLGRGADAAEVSATERDPWRGHLGAPDGARLDHDARRHLRLVIDRRGQTGAAPLIFDQKPSCRARSWPISDRAPVRPA